MTYKELRKKEVINSYDGRRLGYVTDLEICEFTGQIKKIIVPDTGKKGSLFGCCGNIKICFCDIVKIGPDVVVVKILEHHKSMKR